MKKIILIALLLPLSTAVQATSEQQMIQQSKESIKLFASQLKNKLQQGMQSGGPTAAIQVCNTAAVDIAKQVSEQQGWKIGRTSLKVRNSDNKAGAWEVKVLQDFEKRLKQGVAIKDLEYSELLNKHGQPEFRYMKAIPTQGICLSCHGDKLAPAITEKLQQLYPQDQATGFKLGDIRGAFTITRSVD